MAAVKSAGCRSNRTVRNHALECYNVLHVSGDQTLSWLGPSWRETLCEFHTVHYKCSWSCLFSRGARRPGQSSLVNGEIPLTLWGPSNESWWAAWVARPASGVISKMNLLPSSARPASMRYRAIALLPRTKRSMRPSSNNWRNRRALMRCFSRGWCRWSRRPSMGRAIIPTLHSASGVRTTAAGTDSAGMD